MYTGSQVRVVWAGLASEYFTVRNDVEQGDILSSILLCLYIDEFSKKLSLSSVGCYNGTSFTGVFAYAYDIVIIALSTPNATSKLLTICGDFAAQFDIVFNSEKSRFLVVISHNLQLTSNDMRTYSLCFDGKLIENLWHVINSDFTDDDDILNRYNIFNNLVCYSVNKTF